MQVVFIGPPGSGKGTQCQLLVDYINAEHISTGQILRDEIQAGTPEGLLAEGFMSKGRLAPDDLVLEMLRHRVERIEKGKGLLFDGFPRTVAQAEGLESVLRDNARPLTVVLELVVPDEEIIRRLASRGRDDDAQDTVGTRLEVYANQTAPVLAFYRQRNQLQQVDGMGREQEVFARIQARVDACQQKAG